MATTKRYQCRRCRKWFTHVQWHAGSARCLACHGVLDSKVVKVRPRRKKPRVFTSWQQVLKAMP